MISRMVESASSKPVIPLNTIASRGDSWDEILPIVYNQLRHQARRYLSREIQGHTLQPTALVHEAVARVLKHDTPGGTDDRQLQSMLSRVMRHVLTDHARKRNTIKRGKERERLPMDDVLNEAVLMYEQRLDDADLISLDSALDELQAECAFSSDVIHYRFFGGLGIPEIASMVSRSPSEVRATLESGRRFLARRLKEHDG